MTPKRGNTVVCNKRFNEFAKVLIGNLQHQDHIRDIRCLHKYCLCDIIAQLSDSETGIVLLHTQ